MNQKAIQTINPTLEEVQDRFKIWRKARKKRTSIPRDLWKAAIDQTQYYSINTVSKALGLSYTDLKKGIYLDSFNLIFEKGSLFLFS